MVESTPGQARVRIRRLVEPSDLREEMARDVRRGLTGDRKWLPPKYFYDARGSRLFQRITELPEYYQTRAERRILERVAPSLARDPAPRAVVEFGSGSADKTGILLDALHDRGILEGFAPVDVSPEPLEASARRFAEAYPELRVEAIVGDFESSFELPFGHLPRLVLFLGSTIGNLTPDEARRFLRRVGERMESADRFLLGFDLVKDPDALVRAYDDARGVTAEFNLNVLRVLNRELAADFDLQAFRHRAEWNEEASRIEMHLVSERDQRVSIRSMELTVQFREGETILTELSHKFTRRSVERLLGSADLELTRWETDDREWFALGLASPR